MSAHRTDRHCDVVWNPAKTSREELEEALRAALHGGPDPRVSWFETGREDPGGAAAREALDAGAELILAAGGDGTVRAVAEHLAEAGARAELGIIPLGTGNLLARNLGVPLNDLPAAFSCALDGASSAIDVGWAEVELEGGAERRAFLVMAGFGIDANMIVETQDELKDEFGWLAYVESLGRALSASEVIGVRLAADGAEAVEGRAHTIVVGNCGTVQGGVTLLPGADPRDGELDVLVLSAEGIGGWFDTLRNLVWDNGLKRLLVIGDDARGEEAAESSDSAAHRRVETLDVELDEPRVFQIDGDDLGETTRIGFGLQPGAVRVRVP